jgi:hypothetical protein
MDYFIEFNAITGMNAESLVALDDIQLNSVEQCQSKLATDTATPFNLPF